MRTVDFDPEVVSVKAEVERACSSRYLDFSVGSGIGFSKEVVDAQDHIDFAFSHGTDEFEQAVNGRVAEALRYARDGHRGNPMRFDDPFPSPTADAIWQP